MSEKKVIYFDENAPNQEEEMRRYTESKLHNAAIKEQERFDRVTLFDKAINAIAKLFRAKTKSAIEQSKQNTK